MPASLRCGFTLLCALVIQRHTTKGDGLVSFAEFKAASKLLFKEEACTDAILESQFVALDVEGVGAVDVTQWTSAVLPTDMSNVISDRWKQARAPSPPVSRCQRHPMQREAHNAVRASSALLSRSSFALADVYFVWDCFLSFFIRVRVAGSISCLLW